MKEKGIVGFDLDISVEKVSRAFVAAAHREGMFVYVYNIMDPYVMREAASMGIDGIETDYPGILKEMLPR